MEGKLPIPVVVAVVVRRGPNGLPQVMTHIRDASWPGYDTFYNGTWEAVGERMESGENVFQAVARGCKEEIGLLNNDSFNCRIVDFEMCQWKMFTTGKEDYILALEPYIFLQQVEGPQPWIGPGFIVIVPDDFEPKPATGETSGHRWWKPEELLAELKQNPAAFMGLHLPLIKKTCEDILAGKITI